MPFRGKGGWRRRSLRHKGLKKLNPDGSQTPLSPLTPSKQVTSHWLWIYQASNYISRNLPYCKDCLIKNGCIHTPCSPGRTRWVDFKRGVSKKRHAIAEYAPIEQNDTIPSTVVNGANWSRGAEHAASFLSDSNIAYIEKVAMGSSITVSLLREYGMA